MKAITNRFSECHNLKKKTPFGAGNFVWWRPHVTDASLYTTVLH